MSSVSNAISETAINLWRMGRKTKQSSNGWLSGNAVCCTHNNESQDKRGRGGFRLNEDGGISYSCFNCKFKATYTPGYALSFKFRNLLSWLGADKNQIQKLVFEALAIKNEGNGPLVLNSEQRIRNVFKTIDLPENTCSIAEWEHAGCDFDDFNAVKGYLRDRRLDPLDSRFYWTPSNYLGFNRSVIIPYTYKGNIVGYTSRTIDFRNPKYYNKSENNYVYGFDHQDPSWARTIITEGPFDAISVDGLALLGSELNDDKIKLINQLQTEKILVPDKDKDGFKMVEAALDAGWKVSIPPWSVKDVNAARQYLGKLVCLKLITEYATNSIIKIRMYMNG